jgi:hypothetical protein
LQKKKIPLVTFRPPKFLTSIIRILRKEDSLLSPAGICFRVVGAGGYKVVSLFLAFLFSQPHPQQVALDSSRDNTGRGRKSRAGQD